jgi:ubiquinone/menaquinone biosynthesis C-methylase UbiE
MKIPSGGELLNPYHILKEELGVGAGDQLADLGCGGVGHFVIQAGKLVGDKGVVHAVDIIKEALSGIQSRANLEKLHNIKTHWSNLEKFGALKIHDQTLDYTLLINVLFQNKNYEIIIKEAARLLKAHGKLLIIDWSPGRFPVGPAPDEKVDPEAIKALVNQLGLVENKSFNPGKYHFGLIFEKS